MLLSCCYVVLILILILILILTPKPPLLGLQQKRRFKPRLATNLGEGH